MTQPKLWKHMRDRTCLVCGKSFHQDKFPLRYTCDDCKKLTHGQRGQVILRRSNRDTD